MNKTPEQLAKDLYDRGYENGTRGAYSQGTAPEEYRTVVDALHALADPVGADGRNLDQIVGAIRLGEPFTLDEARRAVVAFDVFLNRIQIEKYHLMLKEYFIMAEQCPKVYAGEENSPDNPEFVEWYRAMRSVKAE